MRVKSLKDLETNHRNALRYLGGEREIGEPTGATIRKLSTAGLVKVAEGKGSPASRASLTSQGKSWLKQVMSSGDGPEDLKAMLRF